MSKSPLLDNCVMNVFDVFFIIEHNTGSHNHTMTPKISCTTVSVDHRVILAFGITL